MADVSSFPEVFPKLFPSSSIVASYLTSYRSWVASESTCSVIIDTSLCRKDDRNDSTARILFTSKIAPQPWPPLLNSLSFVLENSSGPNWPSFLGQGHVAVLSTLILVILLLFNWENCQRTNVNLYLLSGIHIHSWRHLAWGSLNTGKIFHLFGMIDDEAFLVQTFVFVISGEAQGCRCATNCRPQYSSPLLYKS